MKRWIANILASIWFLTAVLGSLLLLPIVLLMMPGNIRTVTVSGFSMPVQGFMFLFFFSLVFGLTKWIPAFRICYKKFPWLYSYTTILMMDLGILSIAEAIICYGYEVKNEKRHAIFFGIMIAQLIISRIVMCIYLRKKPMRIERDNYEE